MTDNEVATMADASKAVAWVERTDEGLTRMWSGDLSAWANRPATPEPLYSQATVDELRFELACLQQQYDERTAYTVTHRGAMLACSSAMRDAYADAASRSERAEAELAALRERVEAAALEMRLLSTDLALIRPNCDLSVDGRKRYAERIGEVAQSLQKWPPDDIDRVRLVAEGE